MLKILSHLVDFVILLCLGHSFLDHLGCPNSSQRMVHLSLLGNLTQNQACFVPTRQVRGVFEHKVENIPDTIFVISYICCIQLG